MAGSRCSAVGGERWGAGNVTAVCGVWQPPEPTGWLRTRGELPRDVFWEAMLLTSAVGAKGRVQQIRHGLWLLATAGKGGRKAVGSACCVADLADSAVVLPAG